MSVTCKVNGHGSAMPVRNALRFLGVKLHFAEIFL